MFLSSSLSLFSIGSVFPFPATSGIEVVGDKGMEHLIETAEISSGTYVSCLPNIHSMISAQIRPPGRGHASFDFFLEQISLSVVVFFLEGGGGS